MNASGRRAQSSSYRKINKSSNQTNIQNNNLNIKDYEYINIYDKYISLVQSIWDALGVANTFRYNFISYTDKMNKMERNNIFEHERNTLLKLLDSLNNLKNEVLTREDYIETLKTKSKLIEGYIVEGNLIDPEGETLQEICDIIKDLRIKAINIINIFSKVNKIINQNYGKYDSKILKEEYMYDSNYLKKMKNDLMFLKNCILSRFIEMNNSEIDPFLTCCAPIPGRNINTKLKVPINEDVMKAINDSRYLLIKEDIVNSGKNKEKNNLKNNENNDEKDDEKNDENNIYNENNEYNEYHVKLNNFVSNFNKNRNLGKENKLKKNISDLSNTNRLIHFHKTRFPKEYSNLFYNRSSYKVKLKGNLPPLYNNQYNNNSKRKINIERDEVMSSGEMANLLMDIKIKNKNLNKEIIEAKSSEIETNKKYNELRSLYDKLKYKLTDEENKRTSAEKDVDILQIKISELTKRNQELQEQLKKNTKKKDNDYEIYELKKKIEELENKLENEKKEKKKIEEEKNAQILKLVELINSNNNNGSSNGNKKEEEKESKKEEELKLSKSYKTDFYRGNISDLVNLIKVDAPLDKIPGFLKRSFKLDGSIFTCEYYMKGTFPKIITAKKIDNESDNNIKGICFLSYDTKNNLSDKLILKINCIYAIENLEIIFELMINFIKKNIKFNVLEIELFCDKVDNEFVINEDAKKILQDKLNFKLLKDENKNQEIVKLFWSDNNQKQNINSNNFFLEDITIITTNNEQDANKIKNLMDNNNKDNNDINNTNNKKFININLIYSLLFEKPELLLEISDENKKKELEETKDKLSNFIINEYNWNTLEENQKKITNINIENSLFSKIKNYIKDDVQSLKADFQKKTISINFGSSCSILIDDFYYNRISSDKIKAIKEKNSDSMYFIIPSTDNTVLFYIRQVNEKVSELLANNEKNIYEQFLEFEPDIKKELLDFSTNINANSEDGTNKLDSQVQNSEQKIIYIPSFKIQTHLYSYDIKNLIQNITISNKENNEKLYLCSVDEYMNIELKIDDNIKNCFSFNISEDKNSNMIIKDQFIIGIFANKIINNERLPLMQFFHVKKEDFIPK